MAVLERRKPDRVPMDYWGTAETTQKVMRHLGCSTEREMFERLHADRCVMLHPRYAGPPLATDRDEFGCRYVDADYGTGVYRECVSHPLAGCESVAEIEATYTWPSADWFDYSHIAEEIDAWEPYPTRCYGSEPFGTYYYLRGREQALTDLVLHPDIVHYCLDRLFDLCYEKTRRIFEQAAGRMTTVSITEDMGCQQGLLFSLEHIREFLLPRMKRMVELAHQAGAYVFHHNDGAIRKILPDLIDLGIDILNPIQWRCKGMDRRRLKRDFGDKLIFHGGVDNQHTLAFGSAEDVRREVIDNLEILGAGGGYVLAPCHNIQPVSPPENMVALFETCYEHGWC